MQGAEDSGLRLRGSDLERCLAHYKALQGSAPAPALRAFLDNAPYSLMPQIAIAEMFGPGEFKMRFFGTRLVELCGTDLTGRRASEARADGVHLEGGDLGWKALGHPCGYLSEREVYRKGTRPMSYSITTLALPLRDPRGAVRFMMNYNSVDRGQVRDNEDGRMTIQTVRFLAWVDIGLGTPAPDVPCDR